MSARVLWAIVVGFLLGVFLRSFFHIGLAAIGFVALLALCALVAARFDASKRAALVPLAIACIALGAGVVRTDFATQKSDPTLDGLIGKNITLEGVVFAEPDVRDNAVRLYVRTDTSVYQHATSSVSAGVLIAAPAHAEIAYGDRIRATGKLELPEAFDTGLGRQFDYPLYLAKDGILYELSFAKVERTGKNEGNPVQAAAIWMKQKFLEGLRLALPEPESGLAGGITVGDKRGPGTELSNIFRTTGLVHIVVLSGYNITLVMDFVRSLLQYAPHSVQYGGLSFVVLFFILMSGGAASAVRAGAMALIAVFARATGRVFLAARILGVVSLGMVLWNPYTLAFDPSFQLSALATLGLITFTPFFASHLQWMPEKFGLREVASSTLATQLLVLPLLLYQNGQLPIYSLPANLLALAAVSPAMFASLISAIAGLTLGVLAPIIAFPAYALLAYVIGVAQFFAGLPFASLSIPAFGAWWLALAYLCIGLFYVLNLRFRETEV